MNHVVCKSHLEFLVSSNLQPLSDQALRSKTRRASFVCRLTKASIKYQHGMYSFSTCCSG